jgi:hypothetical protein
MDIESIRMSIISFDIGIKNMAYCVFDTNGAVIDWNISNLMDREPDAKTCTVLGTNKKNNGMVCGKKAKFEKGDACFCQVHAKSSQFMLPDKQCSLGSIKKLKLEELRQLAVSRFISLDVSDTKPVIVARISAFFTEKMLVPITHKKTNAGAVDLVSIGRNMKTEFGKIESFKNVKHVIVENQISPIATRMKSIQGMLAQYFIMQSDDINIEFLSSIGKLKGFEKQNENLDSEYQQHKKDAIFYCTQLLATERYAAWKDVLNTKKKDDLADCFLQGIQWMKRKNIISNA